MRTDMKASPIVVGVDPDAERRTALAWAADEAQRRRRPLRLVYAEGEPLPGDRRRDGLPSWERWRDASHVAGDTILEDALAFVESRCPGLATSTLLAEGHPAWVLAEQSRHAALVVTGSHRTGAARELFSSASVSLPLSARSACPVVVLREAEHTTQQPPYFVVGVDGRSGSAAAMDFAFEEAQLRDAHLRALYVWHSPLRGVLDEHHALQECRRLLAEAAAGRTAAHPGVELHHEVIKGHPVRELSEASAHALGLVVGARGHGGFRSMLLGSVSQGVLQHAYCPVLLVPHPRHQ
ncbi:universal stress protein [Streptomyces ardesiacus]|uniref:Universal stress protein n=1 Tax=Streptomyces ardesiacus TaxID=285564 RepID=A0ABW8HIM9_9ACTN